MTWQHLPPAALPVLMWSGLRRHWHLILGGTMGGSWQLRQIPGLHLPGWSSALLFLALVVLLGGWQWLGWRYRYQSGALHLRRGLWARTDSLLPLAQVQGLQLHQSLLLRWLGLHEVTLETSGDASDYLHLPAFGTNQLQQLRQHIGQPPPAKPVSPASAIAPNSPISPSSPSSPGSRITPEHRLGWPELIRLSLSSGQTLIIGPTLLVLIHRGLMEIDKRGHFPYQKWLNQLDLANQPILLVALVLLLLLLWLVITLGWGAWRYGQFRLSVDAGASGLWHQHSGLVTRYAQNLHPARAGAVIWRQNPLQYRLGRGWLHILVQGNEAKAGDEFKNELDSDHPHIKHGTTFRIPWLSPRQARHWQMRLLAGQPSTNRHAARHQPLSPLYLSLNRRKLIWLPLLAVLALWLGWHWPAFQAWWQPFSQGFVRNNPHWGLGWLATVPWLGLGLVWLVAAEAGIRWRYRHWRFAVSASALRIARYTLSYQRMLLPWNSIQSVQLRQSPLERRLGLASLEFLCLFGKVSLPCLPIEDARTLFNYAAARSALPPGAGQPWPA